jgi:hypothetical protein
VDTDRFYHNDVPHERGDTYLYTTYNTDENKRFPEAAYYFHRMHWHAIDNKLETADAQTGRSIRKRLAWIQL